VDASAKPDPASGLTAELVQAIFPMALRDRRQNKDLFLDVIPEHQIKNDAVFYEGLLRIIANNDYQRLRKYDDRMISSRDWQKTFGLRALRWLRQNCSEGIERDKIADLPEDHFPAGTPGHAIHRFYRALVGTKRTGSDIACEEDSRGDDPPAEDWTKLADELREGAERLNRPDVEAADRLVELAERLAEACRAAAALEAAQARFASRLACLRERLAHLGLDFPENWAKAATVLDLDRIEDRLAEAERNHQAGRRAEQELAEADRAARAALEAQDYTRLGDLSARASDAKRQAERARIAFEEAVSVLVAYWQQDRPGEAPTEPGQAPLPHLQEPGATAPPAVPADEPNLEAPMPTEAGPVGKPTEEAPVETQGGEEPAPGETELSRSPEGGRGPQIDIEPGQPDETEPPTEPAGPVVTAPPESPDGIDTADSAELLAHYLRGGEIALAWHLARLRPTPVPAPVLRALAILPAIQQAEDMAVRSFSGALAELTAPPPRWPTR
jgi:hypothetical protein